MKPTSLKSVMFRKLAAKDYHSSELRKKLKEGGYPDEEVAAAIQEAVALGYLNDEAWQTRFVEKCVQRGWGPRLAAGKLYEKGIPRSIADLIVNQLTLRQEESLARLVAKKGSPKGKDPKEKQRLLAAFARKGFSYESVGRLSDD